ncbi:MAG: hypothetical protein JKY83_07375 [Rhizobiaceae bacterium]|nr:hypothetical protein [Rhizobiaceae bacterium]
MVNASLKIVVNVELITKHHGGLPGKAYVIGLWARNGIQPVKNNITNKKNSMPISNEIYNLPDQNTVC